MISLFVSNFRYDVTEDDLREIFEPYGPVQRVKVLIDRETGRSRGFGFVELEDGLRAIAELDGCEWGGRTLRVREDDRRDQSRPRPVQQETR